ncbi:MAG: GntR family transcriptional regulator [Candidatus Hydrogenedentes bacterium]|nr:GntR family transcriptional regulator [Candidatus Hydrogenedentota bacterium]
MSNTAYNRVAATLRDQILSGSWEGRLQLPTERELCARFDTSRITIRRALEILEDEQLVERHQGVGTFIKSNPERKIPLLTTDYFGSIQTHAPDISRRLESLRDTALGEEAARALRAEPGTALREAVRVDRLRGEPIATDRVLIAAAHADRLDRSHFEAMDFLAVWARRQRIELDYCTQTIEAARADKAVAGLLRIKANEIVLKETNVVTVSGGDPAGLFITHYRHDVFRFECTIDLKSRGTIARRHG